MIQQEDNNDPSPRDNLINSLIRDGYLKTPAIIEAFKAIDRADFVLEKYKQDAYVNAPLPIGFDQTISQPLTVAFMLELLEPKAGEKILDIGAGSGWTCALLGQIAGKEKDKKGMVVGIERISGLKEMAEKNLAKYGFVVANDKKVSDIRSEKGIVNIVAGDGSKGYKKEAPYDKILAGASASNDVPEAWRTQLKIGGRIVAPVENSVIVIDKTGKNEYKQKEYFGFSFVPLVKD